MQLCSGNLDIFRKFHPLRSLIACRDCNLTDAVGAPGKSCKDNFTVRQTGNFSRISITGYRLAGDPESCACKRLRVSIEVDIVLQQFHGTLFRCVGHIIRTVIGLRHAVHPLDGIALRRITLQNLKMILRAFFDSRQFLITFSGTCLDEVIFSDCQILLCSDCTVSCIESMIPRICLKFRIRHIGLCQIIQIKGNVL